MTFYLKYRPQQLKDLDIVSVRETLGKIVSSNAIPHALLFAGTKGTGKTSAARIVAKIINCEEEIGKRPCNKCDQCVSITAGTNIDVIEMDAASNRGIDDIRVLRDAVKLAPVSASKKVYIIDEAHMLTTEASNALLKTLEEPPNHVHFILATTNPEKLIDTIRSRTTLVRFTKASKEEVLNSLKKIVESEKLKIDTKDLEKIYNQSKGSFRDAVKLLENLSMGANIDNQSEVSSDLVLDLITKKDKKKLLEQSVNVSIEDLLSKLNLELLATEGIGEKHSKLTQSEVIKLIELLIEAVGQMKYSPIEELPIQIAFLKYFDQEKGGVGEENDKKAETKKESSKTPPEVVSTKESEKIEVVAQSTPEVFIEEVKVEVQEKQEIIPKQVDIDSDNTPILDTVSTRKMTDLEWEKILKAVRPVNASIEALLRASKPIGFDGNNLLLGVYYKFHKERLDEFRNKKILEDVIATLFNTPVRVSCELSDMPKTAVKKVDLVEPAPPSTQVDITKVAEEVFGS